MDYDDGKTINMKKEVQIRKGKWYLTLYLKKNLTQAKAVFYYCMFIIGQVLSFEITRYVGHLESKERLRIQPAQLFNFS